MRVTLLLLTAVNGFVPQSRQAFKYNSKLSAVQDDPMAELAKQWAAMNADSDSRPPAPAPVAPAAPAPAKSAGGATMDDLAKQWASLNADSDAQPAPAPAAVATAPKPAAPKPAPAGTTMDDLAAQWASINRDSDAPGAPAPAPAARAAAPAPASPASVSMDDLAAQWASRNKDDAVVNGAGINGKAAAAPAPAPAAQAPAPAPAAKAKPGKAAPAKKAPPKKDAPVTINPAYLTKVVVESRDVQREKKIQYNRQAIEDADGNTVRRTLVRGVVGTGFAAAMGGLAQPYLDQQPKPLTPEELEALNSQKKFQPIQPPFTSRDIGNNNNNPSGQV